MMATALGLARRNLGATWPNPSVGCVLAQGRVIVGRGWTQPGGRPHAETEALARAGGSARGATAYVTLEPCSHHGKTGPCSTALIQAGVAQAHVACIDADPRVSGGGVAALEAAGLDVSVGLLGPEASELNAGFFLRTSLGRPLVTLKLATTLDGKIATRTGESRWITGDAARARAHLLRAQNDAVLIGTGTAIADDPHLNCRLPGLADRSPVRIVLDRHLRLDLTSALARTARDLPTWIVTLASADPARRKAFLDCGFELMTVDPDDDGNLHLGETLSEIGARGITRLLVEGGGAVAASLLAADLIDRMAWFRAGGVIGGDGIAAIAPLGLETLDQMPRFRLETTVSCDEDVLETYRVER
jgi:diaminohydroxyphosphoribosylaminopyrimidine deaminase/5-amino-6-(5-phosphoribosylamino)uracil reductase